MVAVGDTIYVSSGRNEANKELKGMYSFDTVMGLWTLISSDGDDGPPDMSYHSMTADDRHVYVFGGCGVAGCLNDLWAFDLAGRKWSQYPLPGESWKGREGPGLAVAQEKIWIVNGFAGREVEDARCFDTVQLEWSQVENRRETDRTRCVLLCQDREIIFICGGEVDTNDVGHLGLGKFLAESYMLDRETLAWEKVDDRVGSDGHPGPRGWCTFAGCWVDGKTGLLVYGGNSPRNDMLDDIFFFAPIIED